MSQKKVLSVLGVLILLPCFAGSLLVALLALVLMGIPCSTAYAISPEQCQEDQKSHTVLTVIALGFAAGSFWGIKVLSKHTA